MAEQTPDYDVIGIGAGFAGLGLIHFVREAGLSVKVFDKASDIGGTWTWNRYPGAATDSEPSCWRTGCNQGSHGRQVLLHR